MMKKERTVLKIAYIILSLIILTGCAATTYGGKPTADPTQKDVYSFTIYKNAFTTREFMDNKAKEEIQKIMVEYGYKDYKILHVESGLLINADTFHVRFFRKPLVSSE